MDKPQRPMPAAGLGRSASDEALYTGTGHAARPAERLPALRKLAARANDRVNSKPTGIFGALGRIVKHYTAG
jgi:hypothetical protein